MHKLLLRWAGVAVLAFLAAPLFAQGIPDPAGDITPQWADYTTIYYLQEGESLRVGLSFPVDISTKGYKHAGNTFYNDYDDDITTGQPGNVGSETNLTFREWDGDGVWCMAVYALYDNAIGGFVFRAKVPVQVSLDGKTISYKHSLVGLGLEDVSFDVNGYWLDGVSGWGDPWNAGDAIDSLKLYSFNPSLVTKLDSLAGTKSRIYFPASYKARATSENITGALDELVTTIESDIGSISPTKTYVVTYNPFSDFPVFNYQAAPNNFFKTFIPGSGWEDNPDWWGMMEGAVFQTMSELKLGYREFFQTSMASDVPNPSTPDNWYSVRLDSTHSMMWQIDHKVTFKAIIGRAIHNLMTIRIGEKLSHSAASAAATAARTKAANAYAGFSGNAFDLDPWIMTGMLLNKLGSNLDWIMDLWTLIPSQFALPTDTTAGDAVGQMVKARLRDGKTMGDTYDKRRTWYPNIASVQAAMIDAATQGNFYGELKGIADFPIADSVYDEAKSAFEGLVSVGDAQPGIVQEFRVDQNYPNPFNPRTTIFITIPERSHVSVRVFDVLGREIATLLSETLNAGVYEVPWNAHQLNSGVYFYRVEAGKHQMTKKAVLLK
ncbi:MAG: T9SS type A sorting domain-containing protein [Bacteroidetes bacterium]|nr:T9SS type A sorting domain-containing protein [Bacteroidota bacterium]